MNITTISYASDFLYEYIGHDSYTYDYRGVQDDGQPIHISSLVTSSFWEIYGGTSTFTETIAVGWDEAQPYAGELVANPEPGTLLLLGTVLAIAGRYIKQWR